MGDATLHLTHDDGFRADISLVWHAVADVSATDLGKTCLMSFNIKNSSEASEYAYKAVAVDVRVDYPTVNGIVWPSSRAIGLALEGKGQFCGEGVGDPQSTLLTLPTSSSNKASKSNRILVVYPSPKTPNAPNGKYEWDLTKVAIRPNMQFTSCTVSGAADLNENPKGCLVGYPGTN
ncbi:hypothetical protein [Paenarthrobacter sp. YJN-5]|uniref:hypothetical protein n=1 Tax=Paenarthrobacter sp. YJN-5 TaxID=2735316 RepID=UPI00187802B8|nr:hypothetical protein [Paenarthrobacter sp. YJN-5]QOT19629.1 hypothetical protein HMI59_23740 [Paenarthrobacter sp. YJN-5]